MIRCLTVHAPYVCAHAGDCCRAGWPIPLEERLLQPLRGLGIRIGPDRLAPAHADGHCVFFEADAGRLCTIHRVGGASMLPSVCRHFPRVVVTDPRGTSVTLSHFCPTAAALLFSDVPVAIAEAPASLALDGVGALEGLDATRVLPPLLTGGVLTDWEGYSAWEQAAVALFDRQDSAPEGALATLAHATELTCAWKPGIESMTSAVHRAFASASPGTRGTSMSWNGFTRPVNAFLAAHAFASWAAYDPRGLRSIVDAVAQALATLTRHVRRQDGVTRDTVIAAMRATDLELRHDTKQPESSRAGA